MSGRPLPVAVPAGISAEGQAHPSPVQEQAFLESAQQDPIGLEAKEGGEAPLNLQTQTPALPITNQVVSEQIQAVQSKPEAVTFNPRQPVSVPITSGRENPKPVSQVALAAQKALSEPAPSLPVPKPVDWLTWLLGLAAIVLLLGLIPFWTYIYWVLQG